MTKADPVESWRSLSAMHAIVRAALDTELRREHDISAVEFEVLESIAACSEGRARMQEVSSSAHLTQSTASRVVARLENEGLAVRTICPDDRRGIFATATSAGRERVAAAAPTYRRVITENMNGDGPSAARARSRGSAGGPAAAGRRAPSPGIG